MSDNRTGVVRLAVRDYACAAAFVLTLLVTSPARAATWYVRQGGDDREDGKSPAAAFRTILRTAQVLNHGDQVVVGPGTYRESALFAERFGTPENRIAIVGDEDGKL